MANSMESTIFSNSILTKIDNIESKVLEFGQTSHQSQDLSYDIEKKYDFHINHENFLDIFKKDYFTNEKCFKKNYFDNQDCLLNKNRECSTKNIDTERLYAIKTGLFVDDKNFEKTSSFKAPGIT